MDTVFSPSEAHYLRENMRNMPDGAFNSENKKYTYIFFLLQVET